MEKREDYSAILIVLLCLTVFPIGLVLLGANPKVKLISKIMVSLMYVAILIVFLSYYRVIPKQTNSVSLTGSTEKIEYNIKRFYTKESLINGIMETIKPNEQETFFCVDLEVTNQGDNKVFYVSLIDDPKVETETGVFYPDLTLSKEPFGDIKPGQTLTGYLVFRLPVQEKPLKFKISDLSRNITP